MAGNFKKLKRLVRGLAAPDAREHVLRYLRLYRELPSAECSCCGYSGKFAPAGSDFRFAGLCPKCGSYERHRLLALALHRGFINLAGKDVLHFGPYRVVRTLIDAQNPASHVTADIVPGYADRVLDLEAIELEAASVDVVFASHVLEHVDDRRALSELFRVLRPGGKLVALVPLVEGWAETYEDQAITAEAERAQHFGRFDHVRYYGADFRARLSGAGFHVEEYTAGPADSVKHRLLRGEKVFLGTKAQ